MSADLATAAPAPPAAAAAPAPVIAGEEGRRAAFRLKTQDLPGIGWSPRMRQRFGYFTPDEWYEGVMLELVGPGTEWLDVGCGHELFPANPPLGAVLAGRCRRLVGLDPDANIERNALVHERARCTLEEYRTDRRFDLISMRMVAEHITDPEAAVAALGRLTRPGGRVVVYTVSKWAPASLVAAATPMAVHHAAKSLLWGTDPEDTFPVAYRMNTRRELARLFGAVGLAEERFLRLDDCRTLARWRATTALELTAWRALRAVGLGYPEACLLGVYRKDPAGPRAGGAADGG